MPASLPLGTPLLTPKAFLHIPLPWMHLRKMSWNQIFMQIAHDPLIPLLLASHSLSALCSSAQVIPLQANSPCHLTHSDLPSSALHWLLDPYFSEGAACIPSLLVWSLAPDMQEKPQSRIVELR